MQSAPLHVAIVCRGLGGTGSVAAVALRQARELARSMRVTLVSDSFAPDETLPHVVARVPNLYALRRLRHVLDELFFARAAKRALRAIAPDAIVVHSHVTAYLSTGDTPFAMVMHGDVNDRPAGTYDARVTALYRFATPRAYRKAHVVFAPAQHTVALAEQGGARRVVTLPVGIEPADVGAETEVSARHDAGPLRILFVGRLAIEKGLDVLLDACELLDAEFELDIIGGGPLEAEIRARASDRGGKRIRLLGERPRRELGAIYRDHHVFCLPARSETFGVVVLEALACGLPVIATNVGGMPDIVQHGTNGMLVPPEDAKALADALHAVARDESLRARLAAHARESVLPRFAWRAIGERMAEVLRTMRA